MTKDKKLTSTKLLFNLQQSRGLHFKLKGKNEDWTRNKIPDEANALLLLTTLARGASADTNVSAPQLKKVQEIIKRETGLEVVSSDVYIASKFQLFENAPLEKSVYRWSKAMPSGQRQRLAVEIAEVCKADGESNDMEAAYFKAMARSLRLTPSELISIAA